MFSFIYRRLDPLTQKRIRMFQSLKRSRISLWLLSIGFLVSLLANVVANDKPVFVWYEGKAYFPVAKVYKAHTFGGEGEVEPDYKALKDSINKQGLLIPPLIWWGMNESNSELNDYPGEPSKQNLLGTDDRGRDVFVRLLYGFRTSILFAVFALVTSLLLGTFVGGLQGFFGGKLDLIGQRFVEIWTSLPTIFVIILVVNIFEPSVPILMLVMVAFLWISSQYYIRGECLRLKNKDFALAATSFGASKWQVFTQHIIPNAITPIVTIAPFTMNQAILFLSFLDFMGLGVQAPTASLGELLLQGRTNFFNAWWLALYPFLTLVILLLLLNFVGEGVRKAFDPRALS